MATSIPTHQHHIRTLATTAVTLCPSRAHVVRSLPAVPLRPGQNEVEIYGLGTAVDEHSLQVEGRGEATITDITVSRVPNRETFEDAFPLDSEDDDEGDSSEEEFGGADSDAEPEDVREPKRAYREVAGDLARAREARSSADKQLVTLDAFANGVAGKEKSDAGEFRDTLTVYDEQRKRVFAVWQEAEEDIEQLEKKLEKARWVMVKEANKYEKSKRQANKAKEAERRERRRAREEKRKEIERERDEKRRFWPTTVYKIVVRLECATFTPGSSRRSSVVSAVQEEPQKQVSEKDPAKHLEVDLSLSYVTTGAWWTPRYDLSINTTQKNATIVYRAEIANTTSETWTDTKVVLSTSQTSFSGLDDKAPTMHVWRVGLSRHVLTDGLYSAEEEQANHQAQRRIIGGDMDARKKKHVGSSVPGKPLVARRAASSAVPPPPRALMAVAQVSSAAASSFGAAQRGGRGGGALFGSSAREGFSRRVTESEEMEESDQDMGFGLFDDGDTPTLHAALQAETAAPLDFESSSWEDNGLTANYDLPGSRTLVPSSTPKRYKIATLHAPNVLLNHIAIPKLRAAAFLRAKLRNPSPSVSLLAGAAGVTLDGSFLGTMRLERVSPLQTFSIPLGVDPAIQVAYPRPTVHRSTQGIFSKERAHAYTRTVFVTNTRRNKVELLVLDQVPVSADERLRIECVAPRGLDREGDSVRAGQAADETRKEGKNWGRGTATLKKDGEVAWQAEIEAGQGAVFKLQYDAKLPTQESIVNA